MMLNTDDTKQEQFINAMHRSTDVLLNCEKCARLYYTDHAIAKRKFDKKIPLLCPRCNKGVTQND